MENGIFDNAQTVDFFSELTPAEKIAAKNRGKIAVCIFRERKKLEMTQGEFATHVGVKQSTISKWESGEFNFTIDKLSELQTKLGLKFELTPVPEEDTLSYTEDNYERTTTSLTNHYTPDVVTTTGTSIVKFWNAVIIKAPCAQYCGA